MNSLKVFYPLAVALTVSGYVMAQEEAAGEWEEWDNWEESTAEEEKPFPLHGFLEQSWGQRTGTDPLLDDGTLADSRARLEWTPSTGRVQFKLKGDLYYDGVTADWESDVREASALYSPTGNIDLKLGRQPLTWGTGDYLFINDQFAKDWQSFFSGRDDEYLKAPQDALRASWYGSDINLELVWMPRFTPDRFINGERFSFFSPQLGQQIAPDFSVAEPSADEVAARVFWRRNSSEFALYGYQGYQGTPDMHPVAGPVHPRLNVWGGSLRRPLAGGLFNTEVGYLDNQYKPDQWRALVGYERELVTNLTASGQLYLERYDGKPEPSQFATPSEYLPARSRSVVTTRLRYSAMRGTLIWSLFAFHSPSDSDGYLRPSIDWRYSDKWQWTLGGNLFYGRDDYTFFGQFDRADNVYLRVKYSF
ncbi:hypothetical protein [Microbulbifer marinus]|uniref:Phosphate-selective porin O and P n=1 Tax=Microbulbifer marinus TaxID=658218 RepID=A0A1H3VRI0_9GAMM|nr:hypothetical protein [Microbulbifer marinus]SDZ77376.1 hypothetical protein SAMN05216562_0203 [Microbulbifer marinus]